MNNIIIHQCVCAQWTLNHWQGNELLAPIFALIEGMAGIIGRVKLKSELRVIIILAVDASAIVMEHWLKVS